MSKSFTLKDCCDFQEGYVNPSQKQPEYFGGNIKWLRASDLNNRYVYDTERTLTEKGFQSAGKSAKLFCKDTIAISKSGTIGSLGILKNEMCGNRAIINIHVKQNLSNLMYIFYTLQHKRNELINKSGGSIQKNLYISALETLTLNHVCKDDQTKIANVLSTLDQKIELNNRINAELESMAKTLYDYWFVQFDFPNEEGKPYKSSGGKMVYNTILKREIPVMFSEGVLDNLGQIVGGSTPDTKDCDNFCIKGVPWITPNDLSNNQGNKYISKGEKNVSDKGIKSASLKKYPLGTVLLTSRAPIGYMAIARKEFTTNQGFKSFIPNKGYPTDFVYYTIKNSLSIIIQFASGSTFKEISTTVLKTVPIVLPPLHIVKDFTNKIDSLTKQQNILEQECSELKKLRDWLLPMLINGQVTVK
ncbi:restriction endonuclease subunit S [Gilliamella apis]|uniref:restriction endonuclease subunit S n=1 Tax=Gilliamella apis TaxID=1970738 RepID=UPI00080EA5F6|nr:restriction endonuclease subunit S [Gilliamella apis]OCG05852.1 hypothetical protein A9G19_00590 [Gilliamella apis]